VNTPTPILSRQNVLSLYLPAVILALGTGIALPALPIYARQFDVSLGVASSVLVASGLGGLVAGIPTGYLLDRLGRRNIILAGPLVTALSSFLVVIAQSFPELLVYRFIGGVAAQMWMLGRLAMVADTGAESQRGRQITGMHAMDSVGRIAGPLVGGLLATGWDVHLPFIVHGLLCLVAVVPSFQLLKETAPVAIRRSGPSEPAAGAPPPLRTWLLTFPIMMFFAAQLLGSVCRGALNNGTLHFYAVYTYDVSAATIGVLGTIASALSVPIIVAAGAVMDRFGRKATIVPGFSLLALALGFMALTAYSGWSFEFYVLAFLVVVATNNFTTGSMQTLSSDIAPAHARGNFFGLSQTIVQVGHVLSPASFAWFAEGLGATAGFAFLGGASLAVVLIAVTVIKEPARGQRAGTQTLTGVALPGSASELVPVYERPQAPRPVG
jgi:MFS family permease